ncbi:MAG: class E sortase [Actinobacteria bacterium]|nr:class E sortase [Actinomycetota bacterium]
MIRKVTLFVGALMVAAGAVISWSLFSELALSNVQADKNINEAKEQIQNQLTDSTPSEASSTSPEVITVQLDSGASFSAIGLLYIPRLRDDVWGTPIVSGTSEKDLGLGVGHYLDSALPGQIGNFAIAGHRATNGEPFARFEELRQGDLVVVETSIGFFTYRLISNQKIMSNEIWVLDAKPAGLVSQANQLITLTTCEPRWNSTKRWAWWGELVAFSRSAPAAISN